MIFQTLPYSLQEEVWGGCDVCQDVSSGDQCKLTLSFSLYWCALLNDASDYLCCTCSSLWIFMYSLEKGVSIRWIFPQYLICIMHVQFTRSFVITLYQILICWQFTYIDFFDCFTFVDGVQS